MQIASFLSHYQLVCISFDISSFSLISYVPICMLLPHDLHAFPAQFLTIFKGFCGRMCENICNFAA